MPGQTLSFATDAPNICLLRLSAIGDVCHAVAVVQQIQRQWPRANITWVIGRLELTLLQGLAGVEFVVFDKSAGLAAYVNLRRQLRHKTFDVLLHMQVALRASLASLCIRAKVKIGFDRARAKEGQWLFTRQRVDAQRHAHVLAGFQAFAAAIGVSAAAPQWRMPPDPRSAQWARETLGDSRPYVVIAPAASNADRNWLADSYAKIADYLACRGFTIVLCGGPAEAERTLARRIQAHCETSLCDLVGKTSLKQLLAVLQGAHLLLAPDTGPTHMAVTVGTPVVGLYAHSNPRRTGPYRYQKYVVSVYDAAVRDQFGRPWHELPWGTRAKGKNLMAGISVHAVVAKVDLLLEDFYPGEVANKGA